MKREPELLQKLVDGISETGTIANSCRLNGVSNGAFFNWCKLSKSEGSSEFVVAMGEEPMPFHEAVQMAQRQVSFQILENFRYRLLNGTNEVARYQGRAQYQRFAELDGWSDAEIRELGLERYRRDPITGEFMPELIHHEPSTQAVLAFLASEFPKQWGNKQTIEVNSRSQGVQVVRHPFAPKPSPVLEIAAPTMIEAPIDVEPHEDDLTDILGDASAPVKPVTTPPVAEPIVATAAPSEPAKPLSDLQRDLLDRLARRPGADRACVLGMPNVGRPEADDLDPRRTGAGFVHPLGAVKMV
ncbi:hypothetical protein [Bradyrhizobium canariense]|uniref:Uncharacterized protein n=1 Tax=Bradyrhizobium canariense TaxID=255045 RepID=A0A1X3FVU7_9BRAD|nr:hypothetical protein [Bradyrhizobium canariense]OSI70870.1 hypothetical protein BSZ22_13205 [Bradyrhizobium canariense]OSI79711.1 hypothetical protein BSZ23_13725 [Bradyrhizobium canariense]OSI92328.1 hypothetical protein BSZ25_12710 [Bradyrhizobium canariense]OSI94050.1 hypothetical protein BSZ24_11465 [Bradyrhizobium canariense]OSJ01777.1 hypothetical protein BSZ18_38920 [Bradyrhizobium canariense]